MCQWRIFVTWSRNGWPNRNRQSRISTPASKSRSITRSASEKHWRYNFYSLERINLIPGIWRFRFDERHCSERRFDRAEASSRVERCLVRRRSETPRRCRHVHRCRNRVRSFRAQTIQSRQTWSDWRQWARKRRRRPRQKWKTDSEWAERRRIQRF